MCGASRRGILILFVCLINSVGVVLHRLLVTTSTSKVKVKVIAGGQITIKGLASWSAGERR